jgi:hypothetical protein
MLNESAAGRHKFEKHSGQCTALLVIEKSNAEILAIFESFVYQIASNGFFPRGKQG